MRPSFIAVVFLLSAFFNAPFCRGQTTKKIKVTPLPRGLTLTKTISFGGRVVTAEGPLPGAVVRVNHPPQMVVTDAEGFFSLTIVPADTSTAAWASYVGFTDKKLDLANSNPDVLLTKTQATHLSRKEQPLYEIKTARKQYLKTMKEFRKGGVKKA